MHGLSRSPRRPSSLRSLSLSLCAFPLLALLSHGRSDPFSPSAAQASQPNPQVEVLRSSNPLLRARSAATVSLQTRFNVRAPLSHDATLVLSVLDQRGAVVASVRNDLDNLNTLLPSSSWLGPISFLTTLPLPTLPSGIYSIRLALVGPDGPLQMTPGPGVAEDSSFRYTIATLRIDAAAPAPDLLPPPTLNLTGYHLTLDEPFTTLSLSDSATYDGARWYTRNEQCCMSTTDGTNTAMVGLLSPENPYSLLPGGGLNLRLERIANDWTSGVLTSVDSAGHGFSQQYGYFEMKARFPPGENTWPAFWLLNTASKSRNAPQGEIDIVEYLANPGFPNTIATTLHDWSANTAPAASHYLVPLPTDAFHTYGMLWTASTMTFYFDGAVTLSAPTPTIMKQPYYLLLDLGIGSGYRTDKTPFVNDLKVEYLRAYAKN